MELSRGSSAFPVPKDARFRNSLQNEVQEDDGQLHAAQDSAPSFPEGILQH
jgi:hypothetical protein